MLYLIFKFTDFYFNYIPNVFYLKPDFKKNLIIVITTAVTI